MEESDWAQSRSLAVEHFKQARRGPVSHLVGLTTGFAFAWVAAVFLSPVLAPLPPIVVGAVIVWFKRTQGVALGMMAAAWAVLVFLFATVVLFLVF
jgi:hypothetical protein